MTATTTVDVVTWDEANGEWVLYLVESSPWPCDDDGWRARLGAIQDRILDAVDAAIDGGVAQRFPDSRGKRVRVQFDAPEGTPDRVALLVEAIRRHLRNDPIYADAIRSSQHVSGLRVVTGAELGRFGGERRERS